MSENNGPVDPYPRTPEGSGESVPGSGAESLPGAAGPDAQEPSAPDDPAPFAVQNEFSAPRPSVDAADGVPGSGEPAVGAGSTAAQPASPYGQERSYDQATPYGQGPSFGQASPYGGASPYDAGQDSQQGTAGASAQSGYQQQGAQPGGYPQQGGYQQPGGQQGEYQQAPGAAPSGEWSNTPPPHLKGVYTGPITGQPASESDAKLWAIFAQLASIIGNFVGAGFLGWLGPLIIFLVYKDRNRFIRYNAAEALNAAIAVVIAEIVLGIVLGIAGALLAVVTFGIGTVLWVLIPLPALLHIIFAIMGAVKANDRQWWNYPMNIRLVK